ncbi:thiamine-phosphate pyrophosphorylase [Candidatus Omnitrophota bacterium]
MKRSGSDKKILRITDANYNRAKEGLRVVEDLCRFYWQDKTLTRKIRTLRHALTNPFKNKTLFKQMLAQRNARKDIGRPVDKLERERKDIQDILYANLQRSKESVRVLEELSKIIDKKNVSKLKTLRYNLYSFEKCAAKSR